MSSSSITDLDYEPGSLTVYGPPDKQLGCPARRWGSGDVSDLHWDPSFVAHVTRFHGGLPRRNWFRSRTGRLHRIYRMVVFASPDTLMPLPESDVGWGDPRLWWNYGCLDTYANIADGCGYWLVPFAVLYEGPHEPYGGDLMHADLLCFDYKAAPDGQPSVVVWHNDEAIREHGRHDADGIEAALLELDHTRFTETVADDFDEFLGLLRGTPQELGEPPPDSLEEPRSRDLRTVEQIVTECPKIADDLRAMQGRWRVVASYHRGIAPQNLGVTTYEISGNRFEKVETSLRDISDDGLSDYYRTYVLGTTAVPKRITFRNVWRTKSGVIYESDYIERGLYSIEGDLLRIATGSDGEVPNELGTAAYEYQELQRLI